MTKPVGAVNNPTTHQCKNIPILFVFNFVQFSWFQFEWLNFPPRPIRPTLPLNHINDNLAVLATRGQIKLIYDLTLTCRRG